jgi:hypothetical protein
MRKVGHAIIRWSQHVQVKLPVTLLDHMGEVHIAYSTKNSDNNAYRARFDKETGILMMRGGLAGEAWIPVLTNENTWYRRVREAGGLVEVLEVPPELPEMPQEKPKKKGRGPGKSKAAVPPATTEVPA